MKNTGVKAYQNGADAQKELLLKHAELVRRIAHHLLARLPPQVQLDDLIQAGMLGLLEASSKYDTTRGASFETYAGIRIRGAMIDEIRKGDWAPRSVHRNARKISATIRDVEFATGREAQDKDIAEAMDLSLDNYHKLLSDTRSCKLFSYEELIEDENRPDIPGSSSAIEIFEQEQFKFDLADAIQNLPEREQLVFSLYYDEELNLKEIGEVLGVSESRVSQIMSQTILRLRTSLDSWIEE